MALRKKNSKPEKITESLVKSWCNANGWWVHVIESKAQYSPAAGVYRKSKAAPEGFSDMVGISAEKIPVYIELKAQGKRSTVRDEQLRFMVECILMGGFAAVIDRTEHLSELYKRWMFKEHDQIVLLADLPKKDIVFQLLRNLPPSTNTLELLERFSSYIDSMGKH